MARTQLAPLVEWSFKSVPRVVDAEYLATNRIGQRTVRRKPLTGTAVRFSEGKSIEMIGYANGLPVAVRSIGLLHHEVDSATMIYRTDWITDESGEPWDLSPDVRLRHDDAWIDGFAVEIDKHGEARSVEFVHDGWIIESMYAGNDERPASYSYSLYGSRLEFRWQEDGMPLNYVERNPGMSVAFCREPTGRLTLFEANGSCGDVNACQLTNPRLPALRHRNQLRRLKLGSELVLAGNALDIEMVGALLSEADSSTVSRLTTTSFAGLKDGVLELLASTLEPDSLILKGPEFEEVFANGRVGTLRRMGIDSIVLER